jgi:hypothetical protein
MKKITRTALPPAAVPLGVMSVGTSEDRKGIAAFIARFPEWRDRLKSGEPVYALPPAIIQPLSAKYSSPSATHRTTTPRSPFLTPAARKAELAFAALCGRHGACVAGDHIIGFDLLTPLDEARCRKALGPNGPALIAEHLAWYEPARSQALTYMGWLTTNPIYQQEVDALRAGWTSRRRRYPLPLWRCTDPKSADKRDREWVGRFLAFMDRWWLDCLATWDLPCPQGLLQVLPGPPHENPWLSTTGLTLHFPGYLNLRTTGDLLERIRNLLLRRPPSPVDLTSGRIWPAIRRERCLANDSLPVAQSSEFETMFLAGHYYQAVQSRYPLRTRADIARVRYAIGVALGHACSSDPSKWIDGALREAQCRRSRIAPPLQ